MLPSTSKASSLKAKIVIDGKPVAGGQEIIIPLKKRDAHPGYFDLLWSVRQLPQFKDKTVHNLSFRYYRYHGSSDYTDPVGGFQNINRNSPANLMSDADLKTWWLNYEGTERGNREKLRMVIYFDTPIQNKSLSCHICGNIALHANIEEGIMLPFCSEACLDTF